MLTPDYPHGDGTVRFLTFESQVLKGNRFGDPVVRSHPVYLPPGFEEGGARRYPVIYALSGYTGTGLHLFGPGTFTEPLHLRLDRLIAAGMPEAIVVGVDAMTRLGGSQYLNGAAGRYEDYVVEEIVAAVDRSLPTVAEAAGRGLLGKSSGGYGALVLGMRHPDLFSAVACHSGDMGFDLLVPPEIPTLVAALDRFEGDEATKIEGFLAAFAAAPKKSFRDGHALGTLAYAAAYSPDPASPLGFRLPFDPVTGEIRDDVWARWLALDPVRMVETCADALRRLRLLYIDCGSRDQYGLHLGARRLHRRLTALDVPHEYEEFDDDHSNVQYRYDVSIPKMAAALGTGAA